ncbi:hypothetical protein O0L34_g5922 [Tuta absoluta]|nr:hypothetical protein O0L34_g5922 [Tuta absoluta]
MNGLASSGLITMDEASCIESTEAGRLMSVYYLDLETMKHIMKIEGTETLEKLLWMVCESHELADMHLRVDERRTLNALNRNNAAATIRFPMKGKITTRQMKLNCIIQAILGCLPIPEPSLNQEAMKVMRTADRVCKCLVAYVTRPDLISNQTQYFTAIVNAIILAKCIEAHLWENSPYVSKQLKGIGPTFSTLLATAGKVNFTLLEESHPRDLERIMNKGAPAGNVLRKQVSLLPKYQITATPVDEKRISIQLLLLNQHQLADNRDQLTAGDSHRCYVVVGDSENYLLLFATFKDKDLIHMYDGTLTYEVTRKHNYEHRILIHCISSNWVGIDVHCEYLFKNIEPPFLRGETINSISIDNTPSKNTKKQTTVTDVYKQRKRKSNEIDVTESKEKRKRDTALVEKFKLLKNSFEVTSKELRDDLTKSAQMSNTIIGRIIKPEQQTNFNETSIADSFDINFMHPAAECNAINIDDNGTYGTTKFVTADHQNNHAFVDTINLDDEDNFVVDSHINSIMNEIETDILKTNNLENSTNVNTNTSQNYVRTKPLKVESSFFNKPAPKYCNNNAQSKHEGVTRSPNLESFLMAKQSLNDKRKQRPTKTKTNYSFMDTIENKVALDDDVEVPQKESVFSETIKNQIEKFLQSTNKTKPHDMIIEGLLNCTENISQSKKTITSPIKIENNALSDSEPIPISLELPEVSVSRGNVDIDNKDMVKMPSENVCAVQKDSEHVNSEIVINTSISNDRQNIDKIVEEIEREYNDRASKASHTKQNEENTCIDSEISPKVIKLTERKQNDNIYFENEIHNKQDTNTRNADGFSEVISRDLIDNNRSTKKNQGNPSEKQIVVHRNLLTENSVYVLENRSVVSLNSMPKSLEYGVNKFSEPYSINAIMPTNETTIDNHAKNLNKDICSHIRLNCKAKCPSTSRVLVAEVAAINETEQSCNNVHSHNQNDDDSKKDADNSHIISIYDEKAFANKKQVVNHVLTNNSVNVLSKNSAVTLKTLPKSFNYDTNIFNQTYCMNSIMPTNITTIDDHKMKLNKDVCSNIKLDSMTQYRSSTPKDLEPIGEAAEINENKQCYDDVHGPNQIYKDNEKNALLNHLMSDYDDRAFTQTSENEKPDNYINRYSFSATKIKFSTKNLPNHQIKIIKKLKVDLDVTEIVSKGTNKETAKRPEMAKEDNEYRQSDEKEGGKPQRLEQYYAASIDTMNMLQHLNRKEDFAVRDDNTYGQQTEISNKTITKSIYYTPPTKYSSPGIETHKETNIKERSANKETVSRNYHKRSENNIFRAIETNHSSDITNLINDRAKIKDRELTNTEILTSPTKEMQVKRKNVEEIEQYKKYLRDIAGAKSLLEINADNTSETKEKINMLETYSEAKSIGTKNIEQCNDIESKSVDNIPSETGDKITVQETCLGAKSFNTEQCNETKINKIENILHKYSGVLRKNNFHINNTEKHSSISDVVRPPTEKIKKAYKISDIQNLRIPLPKTLIAVEASRTPRLANDQTITRVKDFENYEVKINTPRTNEYVQVPAITDNNTVECFTDKLPEDIPEYYSPEIGDNQEDIASDFGLDQSMFNPKLLLEQCFTKDECNEDELIIPPPSDFCDDENIYSPVKLGETTFHDYSETEQGITSNYDNDKSIFEDDNNSVLTPSVEIETWTLARGDEETYDRDFSKQRHTLYNKGMSQKNEASTDHFSLVRNQRRNNENKSCTVLRRNLNCDVVQGQVELTPFNLKETGRVQDPRRCPLWAMATILNK